MEEKRYYAVFDPDGWPMGFYVSDVHGEIDTPQTKVPSTAVPITRLQWQEFLNNQAMRRWDGTQVVEGVRPPPPTEVS